MEDARPVFREPWEAQAFGMALVLHERGLFKWDEWAQALSAEIRAAQAQGDPDLGNTYYRHRDTGQRQGHQLARRTGPLSTGVGPCCGPRAAWAANRTM